MVEITIDNFDQKFQEINYCLQKANFLAIDLEFSGLHLENDRPSFKDTSDQRYKKLKKSVQMFSIVQIGISAFRHCTEQKSYIVDTFNFYLFPRTYGFNWDLVSCQQNSAIEFLCKYEFDFNKLFYKGIPFMNQKEEKQFQSKFENQIFFAGVERDLDEKQIQIMCSSITDWLLRASDGDFHELEAFKDIPDFVIHNELRGRFDEIWTHQNAENKIVVEKVGREKRKELEDSQPIEHKNAMQQLLGFTKVFRLMVQYKKPLIVHNGFMDLLFMYEKFHDTLPETINEFKKNVNDLFPLVYDTKHISIECKKRHKEMKDLFDSTILEPMFTTLNRELAKKCLLYLPSIKHSTSSNLYSTRCHAHEAGYDAFMCGTVFLKLAHAMTTYNSKNCYNVRAPNMNDYFQIMKPYENNVQLIKASLNYINLCGKDPRASSIIVLFVKSKKRVSPYELINAFSTFGFSEVYLNSNKTTAFVHLDSSTNAKKILSAFKNNDHYDVSLYNFWKHSSYAKPIVGICTLITGAALAYFFSCRKI